MLISQSYSSETAQEPLQFIFSNSGFYIYKDGMYYENIIAPASVPLTNYLETNIAIPSKKLSKEEVYDLLFNNLTLTKNQVDIFLNQILFQFKNLSDADALEVSFIFPKWAVESQYTQHEKIKYQNNLYEVLQDHTANSSNLPNLATNLYRKIKSSPEQALEWEQKAYEKGDRVKYGEHVFESLVDDNSWSPEIFPNAWELIQ